MVVLTSIYVGSVRARAATTSYFVAVLSYVYVTYVSKWRARRRSAGPVTRKLHTVIYALLLHANCHVLQVSGIREYQILAKISREYLEEPGTRVFNVFVSTLVLVTSREDFVGRKDDL